MLRMELLARRVLARGEALAPTLFRAHAEQRRGVLTIKKFTRPNPPRSRAQATPKPKAAAAAAKADDSSAANVADAAAATAPTMRLAKRIAMSGLCSRREAEKRIQSFDVTVNGHVVSDVATVVDLDKDVVAVDGRVLSKTQKVKVWMAHKMKGELVTSNDPQGRATIFDRLRVMGLTQHMMPVGRLDFNTEGLLLFTNDGDYAREMEHPKTEVARVYRALVRGNVAESKLQELQRGPLVDGIKYRPIKVTVQSTDKKDSWLQVKVTEGKNREVRKALAHVRLVVKQLIRVQYGPYRLADLPSGAVLEVRAKPLEKKQYRKRDDDKKR
ncbi:RNA pseudouridine synthase [Phytophthora cinnamomi]|uniref:RNA pseudouridine synthase n=1 Tax=Phytophthora cinnamomi TaxID=4785 RepID=UPI003559DE01|nr:RNA pseudouridine synthase [Phytophthora cinnamomi]